MTFKHLQVTVSTSMQTEQLPCEQCEQYVSLIRDFMRIHQTASNVHLKATTILEAVKSHVESFTPKSVQKDESKPFVNASTASKHLWTPESIFTFQQMGPKVAQNKLQSDSGSYSHYELRQTGHQYKESEHCSHDLDQQMSVTNIDFNFSKDQDTKTICNDLLKGLEQHPFIPFDFKIKHTIDSQHFIQQGKKIYHKRKDQKLSLIHAQKSIPKTHKQKFGISILRSTNNSIYFGLFNELYIKEKTTAKTKGKNMISYKTAGGKCLNIMGRDNIPVPSVQENNCLWIETDYQQGVIEWFINDDSVYKVEKIDFGGYQWFPFITMKHEEDAVQLLTNLHI